MMTKTASALALVMLTAACGSPQWYHPTMTDDQARVAAYNCQRDAQALIASGGTSMLLVAVDQGYDCMTAHGFKRR